MKKALLIAMACAATSFGMGAHTAEAALFSDFSFGTPSGTSYGGSIMLGGVNVTFSATDAGSLSYGALTGFRAPQVSSHSVVTFSFDHYISEFYLDLVGIDANEITHAFNIGTPTTISGTLIDLGGGAISTWSYMHDNAEGRLSWTGIYSNGVSFQIDTSPTSYVANYSQFGISVASAPEPTSILLFGAGIFGFGACGSKSAKEIRVKFFSGRGQNA